MSDGKHITGSDLPDDIRRMFDSEFPDETQALVRAWQFAGNASASFRINPPERARVRRQLLQAIGNTDVAPIFHLRPIRQQRMFLVRAYAMTACVAVLLFVSFLVAPTAYTIRVPSGQSAASEFVLPDGSIARISAGSLLSWSDQFGKSERRVTLKGEAYFEVVKSSSPFFVDTYNARTAVLGTRFSVKAWPSNMLAATEVVLSEGKVALSARGNRMSSVMLEPGFASSVRDQVSSPRKINVERSLMWIDGGFSFSNQPVGNVLRDLERRYDLRLNAPASIRLRRINYFKKSAPDVKEVLDEITSTIGVRFRKIAGGYELFLP